MANLYKKSFDDADEIKSPPKAHVEVVKLGNMNASRLVLQPGWRWSECIKPVVGGDSCQAGHVGVIVAGQMTCIHDDGSEITVRLATPIILPQAMMAGSMATSPASCMRSSRPVRISDPGKQPEAGWHKAASLKAV